MSINPDPTRGSAGVPCEAPAQAVRWYLVETEVGREILADSYLTRIGFQTYLPSTMRTLRHARQRRTIEIPYFPGYLFVAVDLASQSWHPIERAPGVVRLLLLNQQPAPAPVGLVEALMELGDLEGISESDQPRASDSQSGATALQIAERLGITRALAGDECVRRLLATMREGGHALR